ncbi:TetR/AcrR family transcriptional regulator [Stakelama tenebrarum]|uniref:TetR/AcrR family transcriptional regulator n=1 Tax=Stakelama tenebrarum TaxID=2711215 RepID=A0A6G6Y8D2_9SPHN|nr:TetR/AcrR family transcriptional regulator [Sphingosinithalassobacter tenebrarum]QIG80833.1 TetR/AcrR family transcriptional regulator [Sphingosinithalassobacter tenebrarum]
MAEPRQRRTRDPAGTREAILRAARTLLAKDGPEAVSLSEVAHLAGVNRGTAYQHFKTREKLIEATADSVSDEMFRILFGDTDTAGERRIEQVDIADTFDRLAEFAMENPELCRIWLLQLLSSPEPTADRFWREYSGSIDRFARTDLAADNVDAEALSVITLAGAFMWPVWAHSHSRSKSERDALGRRFSQEVLRLCMYGSVRPEKFPEVAERLGRAGNKPRVALRAVKG